jgi:hypothetical protein
MLLWIWYPIKHGSNRCGDLKLDRLLVVYPGSAFYPNHPKAAAMSLADARREVSELDAGG